MSGTWSVARGMTSGWGMSACDDRPWTARVKVRAEFPGHGLLVDGDEHLSSPSSTSIRRVIDVGDVHDPGHPVAREQEHAAHEVGEDEASEVADMRRRVDRRAAAVHRARDPARAARRARPAPPSVFRKRRFMSALTSTRQSALIARPAPSSPARLAVAAVTLTRAAVEADERRRSSPPSPRDAPRRGRGRAPRIVTSTCDAGRRPPAWTRPTTSPRRTALSMPAVSGAPEGKMRPRSPMPAAARSASQTAWSTTSPSE